VSQGRGEDLLETLTLDEFPKLLRKLDGLVGPEPSNRMSVGQMILEGQAIDYTPEFSFLFQKASRAVGKKTINSDDIILAELSESGSFLTQLLKESGTPEPIFDLAKVVSEKIVYKEEGVVRMQGFNISEEYDEARSLTSEPLRFQPRDKGVDIKRTKSVEKVGKNAADEVVIRPKWTSKVIDSLENNTITTIVTDLKDEANSVVESLASQLVKDTDSIFGYNQILRIKEGALEQNPGLAINEALEESEGSVLYIPDLPRFLDIPQLRVAIASRNVKIITSLSEKVWKKVSTDSMFQDIRGIYIESPDVVETIKILEGKKEEVEGNLGSKDFKVTISKEAIKRAAVLADRYYREILPPGGALRLLTSAITMIKIRHSNLKELHNKDVKADGTVNTEDVEIALKMLTGIEVNPDNPEKYLKMESKLKERVVGQDEAIEVVSDAIRRAQAGLKDPKRPIGSFMFMGPSGVGKTELARSLAWFLFDDEEAMVRLDMSEFQEKHTVSRMIGAPPGYVGYDEGGQLTEAVRRKPYSVVVFDETEKAHPEVLNVLLQIMEDGRLTDGQGRTVDFRNTVIIMTGNVGSEYFQVEEEMGKQKVVEAVNMEIKDSFRPEFLNRIDKTIVFNSLKPEHILKIVDIQIKKLNRQLLEQAIDIRLTDEVKELLSTEGYNPEYGARPLRRAIQNLVETPISKQILSGKIVTGDHIVLRISNGKIIIEKEEIKS
jgi:ATP-dependent Clp protease ATP-binding subunit ClpA